jgi:hypothetical protein
MTRTPLALLAAACIASWPVAARADDKAACFDGATQGQTLRDQHKLVEARAQFAICARQACPKQVSKDCTAWLEQVDQAMPTVVVSAKDAAGHDLIDVAVTMDDRPFAAKLTGEAVPVNPGLHVLHFETKDGGRLDHQVLVREGLKNQSVDVVIAATPAAPSLGIPPARPAATAVDSGAAGARPAEAPAGGPGPWRTIGFVAGGAGVAGLGVGAAFGLKAMSDKSAAQCDASNACKPGPLSDARTSATISSVGFIAGGVLLAGGAALVLLSPRGTATERAALHVAPAVGARDAGLLLQGSW